MIRKPLFKKTYAPEFKPKHIIPKPENVAGAYAFSFNPSLQYEEKTNRFDLIVASTQKLFSETRSIKACVWAEISSLGRVHFHGFCGIYDIFDFYNNFVIKLTTFGTVTMEPIVHYDIWRDYCLKMQHMMPEKYRKGIRLEYIPKYMLPAIPKWFSAGEHIDAEKKHGSS